MIYITQPTFFPWTGYFSYLLKCDKLIFLDDVQFNKRSWQQRNKILINNEIKYITLPVNSKGLYHQKIQNVKISDIKSLDKIFDIIKHSYSKTKFFNNTYNELKNIKDRFDPNETLSEINIKFIKKLCELLELNLNFIKSSDLKVDGNKSNKLINICRKLNEKKLLQNEGSVEYIKNDIDKFHLNKIQIEFFKYIPVTYEQKSDKFKDSLSIIDLLFNEGPNSKNILAKGLEKINFV